MNVGGAVWLGVVMILVWRIIPWNKKKTAILNHNTVCLASAQ